MSSFLLYMPENSLENFDTDLQIFYHEIVLEELNVSKSANFLGVKQALKDVVYAYKKGTVESNASKILFNSSEKRCAYVLKHCPCFTSAVAKHFLQLLKRNSSLLELAICRRQINLCCLGGGPGTEAVAIAKIVDIFKNAVFLRSREPIHIRVIEVDLSKEWRATAELVLQIAQRNPAFCDSERIKITFELVEADLTEPLKEEVEIALREADIITMVYFVSAVNGSKAQNRCGPMLEHITEQAKPGALLFYLDSAKTLHYNSIRDSVSKFKTLRLIYGPFIQEFHTLSMRSIKKFIELYFDQLNAFSCLTNCFITCIGWVKEICSIKDLQYRRFIKDDRNFSCSSDLGIKKNRKWNKMVEYNTRRQERFRQRVENLFLSQMKMNFETGDREDNDYKLDTDLYYSQKNLFYAGKAKHKRIMLALE